jgi:hypothetical protein
MDKLGHPKKRAWLAAYAKCGVVRQSCAAADVSHGAYYGWLKDDPQFAEAVRYAKEEFIERLEMEADRRAVEGIPKLKFHNGKPVIDPRTGEPYVEREYSDLLLIFLLKSLRPDVYRERHVVSLTRQEREARIAELLAQRGSSGIAVSFGYKPYVQW